MLLLLVCCSSKIKILPIYIRFLAISHLGDGSIVVDLLFNYPLIVSFGSVFGPYFGMHYLVSFLVLQSS